MNRYRNAVEEARLWASTLTPRKLANVLRLRASYELSRRLGRVRHRGMPMSLGVEPTTACNLRCPQCVSGLRAFARPTGRMPLSTFRDVLDELHRDLCCVMLYFQGEPYLNPEFLDMAAYAQGRGVFTMSSTNGHFLDPGRAEATVDSGLHHLTISVDGADPETYSQYRVGGDLERVLSGIRNLMAARERLKRRTPFVDFQCIVFKQNEGELERIGALARRLGVDRLTLKTPQFYDLDRTAEMMPRAKKFRRYIQAEDGTWRLNSVLPNRCWRMWRGAELTWDGRVVPCCFDKNAEHSYGQLGQTNFRDIWKGDAAEAFRMQLLTDRAGVPMCRNCTEGLN